MSSPCPRMKGCPVFPLFQTETALATMQALYCEGAWSGCARYQSMADGVIPARTLLPDGAHLSRKPKPKPKP